MPNLEKIHLAKTLLKNAIEKHGNKIIVGYSGGKDSKVILHLARQICPTIVAVHNSHPEEKCDYKEGIVIIKQPKSNFAEYLKVVDIEAQIDGTRLCEEGKSVIFNGKEIERFEMTDQHTYNPKGVFDLEIYYPILDWTDKEVWDYIGENNLMSAYEISIYKPSRPYRGAEASPFYDPLLSIPVPDAPKAEGCDPK
jgi:3'-phosphoadenosine 5'-phosphosulfate sulfotransferase (PAPS reductase)/FAD synthetase